MLLDASSRIPHFDFKHVGEIIVALSLFAVNGNLASWLGEFECVALVVNDDLLQAHLVSADDEVVVVEPLEVSTQFNVAVDSLVFLNTHHFFDGALYVEVLVVFSKNTLLDLGQTQEVRCVEVEHRYRAVLDLDELERPFHLGLDCLDGLAQSVFSVVGFVAELQNFLHDFSDFGDH